MLLLRFLGYGQTKDLVDILPRNGKLDVSACTNGSYAAIFLVDKFEGEFLALGYREADCGEGLERLCRGTRQTASCRRCAVLRAVAVLNLALLSRRFGGGL